jgi:dihydroorotase
MTVNPARILDIPKGTLQPGADADVTIIDPNYCWTVSADNLHSKSKNSPFLGWELFGKAEAVFLGGVRKI